MYDPTLVTLLKMRPHYSQSSRENATPFSVTSPLVSYKDPPPRGKRGAQCSKCGCNESECLHFYTKLLKSSVLFWYFIRELT